MLALLLTLAILPQGTNQARLHPADALVMFEVPDVAKLVTAYDKAPMIAMLRDAEVRKSFYGAFEGTGIDVDEELGNALKKLGLPEAFADAPLAGIRHYLDGISAASFSFSADRQGLEALGPRAARLSQIGIELALLEEAIEQQRTEKAILPADLGALGLEASKTQDPWNHPYDYHPAADGTYVLRSLGADGKPGGSGDDADITAKDAKQESKHIVGQLGCQLVIEFRSSTALEELRTIVANGISKSPLKTGRTGPFQMSGMQGELQSWSAPDGDFSGVDVWLMRAQNMLVLGAGRSTPEAFAARLADSRVQTAAEQFYAGLIKEFGATSGATIVQGSLRIADYADAIRSLANEDGEDSGAFDMLESMLPNVSLRMQLIGDRFVTESVTKYIRPRGLVAQALALAPLPKELLTAAPADAIAVYATSLDGPMAWAAIKQEINKDESVSKTAQEELAKVEEKYHFSVEKDIFGSLGSGALMYLLPLKGVVSIPGMALVVSLKDPAAMQRGIEGLMQVLGDEAGEEFKVRSKPYKDAPVWTFNFGKEDANPLTNQFSPSIAIVKNRLIVTLNANHIKKEIKRALGEVTDVHLIATEGHRPPEDATSFAYMDWAALLNGMYEGGRGLLNLTGAATSMKVDASELPKPELFTHFYRPTIYFTRIIPDGVYMRNESSFGPEVWFGLAGVGAVTAFAVSEHTSSALQAEKTDEPVLKDAEVDDAQDGAPASGDTQQLKTTASMLHVATTIAVYQMETGKYPANLAALLVPTKDYPKGYLGEAALPDDGWGHGLQYALLDGGKRYRLWSVGPDGVDQQGAGDDIVSR